MTERRRLLIPAYLGLCLLLGGASAAGYAANLVLQLVALPILVWAAASRPAAVADAGRGLTILACLLVALLLVQLVPLPPAVWTLLPGTGAVADGYRLLGLPPPWRPVSLTPEATGASLAWLLPSLAVLFGIIRLGAFRASWIAGVILFVMGASVVIGALQMLGGRESLWYFYDVTNIGNAVGFFANSNHAATLLVVAIPYVAALQASNRERRASVRQHSAVTVIVAAVLVVIAVGLVINTSLAGIGLAVPAAMASFLLLRADGGRRLVWGTIAVGALAAVAAAAVVLGPFDSNLIDRQGDRPELRQFSRAATIGNTLAAVPVHLPLGSGMGSFRQVYRGGEDPDAVSLTYINHAHSDVAEVALELGLPGIALMVALVLWWLSRVVVLWRDPRSGSFARAGAIAAAVVMAHSLVDYPLRTAAIGAVFAASLALMAGARPHVRPARNAATARHLGV